MCQFDQSLIFQCFQVTTSRYFTDAKALAQVSDRHFSVSPDCFKDLLLSFGFDHHHQPVFVNGLVSLMPFAEPMWIMATGDVNNRMFIPLTLAPGESSGASGSGSTSTDCQLSAISYIQTCQNINRTSDFDSSSEYTVSLKQYVTRFLIDIQLYHM
jgi:hypothetical protein